MVVGANHFYPRPPRGGRHASRRHRQHRANFYPRPPRGGRQWGLDLRYFYCGISIHALREEGDTRAILTPTPGTDFYPRPPRGGRPSKAHHNTITSEFLSTPSARRATIRSMVASLPTIISIHALREEGDPFHSPGRTPGPISIHALREEGDVLNKADAVVGVGFLSTPSARRATSSVPVMPMAVMVFLSTPSARRATVCGEQGGIPEDISIHALREEGDRRPLSDHTRA